MFFKARINSYLNGPCSVKEVAGFKNKLKYTQENVGAKAEPPTRQTSVVFPTRVWEFLHFFPVIVVFVIYHATTVD